MVANTGVAPLFMAARAGLGAPWKNSLAFRALEGRKLIAGGNALGNRGVDTRPCRGRISSASEFT